MIRVRGMAAGDAPVLARIFWRGVREGAAGAYDAAQRAAWCPAVPEGPAWETRLAAGETLVAERDGAPVGFMTWRPSDGVLDLAFVLPEEMGRGTAGRLADAVEADARAAGLARLTTEASDLARPFLARRGWRVVAGQTVERQGVRLRNTLMELRLDG